MIIKNEISLDLYKIQNRKILKNLNIQIRALILQIKLYKITKFFRTVLKTQK